MTNLFQPVAPIRVEAPKVSLLTVARTLPAGTEWRSGISHLPNGCSPATGHPNCEVNPGPVEKCLPLFQTRADFAPWMFYVPDGCDVAPFYAEDWNARGEDALKAYTPWAISNELDTGAMSGNPSLISTAVDISSGAAIPIVSALSALIRARVNRGLGGIATAHVPAWLVPSLADHYQLDDAGAAHAGGILRISPGPGYTGFSPTSSGHVAPPVGEGWIYITGPVEYEVGPITTQPDQDHQQRLTNRVEVYSERAGILRFDPCGVFAIRAKADS